MPANPNTRKKITKKPVGSLAIGLLKRGTLQRGLPTPRNKKGHENLMIEATKASNARRRKVKGPLPITIKASKAINPLISSRHELSTITNVPTPHIESLERRLRHKIKVEKLGKTKGNDLIRREFKKSIVTLTRENLGVFEKKRGADIILETHIQNLVTRIYGH